MAAMLAFVGVALLAVIDPNGFLARDEVSVGARYWAIFAVGFALLVGFIALTLGDFPGRKGMAALESAILSGSPEDLLITELAQARYEARMFAHRTTAVIVSYTVTLTAVVVVMLLGMFSDRVS
ncbi:hypothetical protein [Plantibacter sp. YIM 135249]|uniref:hypothetical protein n=1 Tax=Plantibacter sp. YIM 135249 TaxID=3423918 RepID=UPI003D348270